MMKSTIGILACTAVAAGAGVVWAGTAGATTVDCVPAANQTLTKIDGGIACGAQTDATSRAAAYGIDGIGYAKGAAGASALGVGMSGGVGASEGTGGVTAALGNGPGSVAISSVNGGTLSVAVALRGAHALVADPDQGVVCEGVESFAWNASSGAACLVSDAGTWRTGPPNR